MLTTPVDRTAKYPLDDAALRWLEVLLQERFGHIWRLSFQDRGYSLSLHNEPGAILFSNRFEAFGEARSDLPCAEWNPEEAGLHSALGLPLPAPGVKSLSAPMIDHIGMDHHIHYDILGLAYWMLNRIEELGRSDLDAHGRFPAVASHAYQNGYLERPIVDEWLNILGQVIQRTWPAIKLKKHAFSQKVSHDVDVPSRYGFRSWPSLARGVAGDIVKRRDLGAALRAPWIKLASRQNLHSADPDNTFDWVMDVSERHVLTSGFYFICGRTAPQMDADYELEHPAILSLMRRIHERGHEIGLHPSYNTYQDPAAIVAEANRLRAIAESEGIRQTEWGGRMHYLRWEQPTTLRALSDASMDYDSTLCFADLPGFRCGTCHEYTAFDPVAQEVLRLRIRPLVAMECTVMESRYMGLGSGEAAFAKFKQLKDACRSVKGCFTLLWHNSSFNTADERRLYEAVLNHDSSSA